MSHSSAWIPLDWPLTKCCVYSEVSQVRAGSNLTSPIDSENTDLPVRLPKPPRNTSLAILLHLPHLAEMFVANIRKLKDAIKSRNPVSAAGTKAGASRMAGIYRPPGKLATPIPGRGRNGYAGKSPSCPWWWREPAPCVGLLRALPGSGAEEQPTTILPATWPAS